MADSEEKKNQKQPGDFADDLDSMLDDVAYSMTDTDELMDDDDAIDQLLKDNTLETQNESNEELEDLFSDDSRGFDFDDEFGPAFEPAPLDAKAEQPKNHRASADSDSEIDEFAEIDEFSDIDEFADEPEPASKPGITQNQDDYDFTVAEFDISNDDSGSEGLIAVTSEGEDSIDATSTPISEAEGEQMDEATDTDPIKTLGAVAIDSAITEQIEQLFSEQAALKRQLDGIAVPAAIDQGDEIDRLAKAQQAFKKQVDERIGKVPIIAYSALGIAIAGLIMAAAWGYSGWDTNSEIEELAQRVVALEDNQEAMIVKNNDQEINEINAKIDQQNQTLTELAAQLPALTGAGVQENIASNEELSAAASQQKTLNDSIAALEARIKLLETKASPAVSQKAPKTAVKKPVRKASRSQDWSVNLVSFRQEWYANRKAAEFAKKGIPVDVIAVQVKGEPWYRLTVKGFKTKAEASAYAAQAKKDFNLDSVWLGKD